MRGTKEAYIDRREVATGRVDAVGPNVTPWKAGDRVGVGWHGGHCFVCIPCRKGDFINCEKAQITGVTLDGGYAEYAVVRSEAVARIPDGLDAAEVGPLLCAGVTTYNSLRNSGARPGDTVAVQSIGGLGHLAIQYAARMGFRTVALSHGEEKRALARELGASEYIDTQKTDAAERQRDRFRGDRRIQRPDPRPGADREVPAREGGGDVREGHGEPRPFPRGARALRRLPAAVRRALEAIATFRARLEKERRLLSKAMIDATLKLLDSVVLSVWDTRELLDLSHQRVQPLKTLARRER